MPKRDQLFVEHLENVSWKVLEEYSSIVREMIRGRFGIYALYKREKLYYVGLASNLRGRLKTHLKDRHEGKWERFSVYLTVRSDHMKELESLLLKIVKPPGNKQSGKFPGSKDLRLILNRAMRDEDADRRARLLGGHVARRRRRQKTAKARGTLVLAGVVERRILLKAWRKGWEYRAALRKDGYISYEGELYESPSAAAKAALKHPCGGWQFWHFKGKNGDWTPLGELRT